MANIKAILEKRGVSLQLPQIEAAYKIERIEESACKVACPAGVNVKAYVGLIAAGKFEQALEIVKRDNPFPGICGRVCTHPCEEECRRGEIDEPVAIRALKRFIADYELKSRKKTLKPIKATKKEKIAIVGSGPCGLTAASDLIRLGYRVTVFEELSVAGGMLSVGIPSYRLPRRIIKAEISAIEALGVQIKRNTRVEDPERLLKDGYKAVFIAIGAHKGLKLRVPGEDDFRGLIDCTTFLRRANLGYRRKPGRKAIVIGGGNSAIDSARTALRLGCDEVHILYRRSRKEMPAEESEIGEAEAEGVTIDYLAAPVRILGEKGKVVGMEAIRMRLGEPDESGRRRPVPIEGSEFVIEADVIIPAISQKPDVSFLPEGHKFKLSKWESFEVNPDTLETNRPGLFAGGDAVTGPKTVIDAIAAGHRAADSVDSFLRGRESKKIREEPRQSQIEFDDLLVQKRQRIELPTLPLKARRNFKEVNLSFSEELAIEEARRCLKCGPCYECVECIKDCDKKLIVLKNPEAAEDDMLVRTTWVRDRFPSGDEPWTGFLDWKKGKRAVETEAIVCVVVEDFCRGCGTCESLCEYSAVRLEERGKGILVAAIDQSLCKGCGTCAAACPSGAITANHFTDAEIETQLREFLGE